MVQGLFSTFLESTKEDWNKQVEKDLKGKNIAWTSHNHSNTINLEPYYTLEDLEKIPIASLQAAQKKYFFTPKYSTNFTSTFEEGHQECIDAFIVEIDEENSLDTPLFLKNSIYTQKVPEILSKKKKIEGILIDIFTNELKTGQLESSSIDIQAAVISNNDCKSLYTDGTIFHNSGGNTEQELAFSLALWVEYLDIFTQKGIKIEKLLESSIFSLATGSDYCIEIAKIRAFRFLYAQILENYGVKFIPACVFSETSLYEHSLNAPSTNILRTTTQAMAAISGGCDWLSVRAFDYPKEGDFGNRIARNIFSILKNESYFCSYSDVAAGSYALEFLTWELCKESWKLFKNIENSGGFRQYYKSGELKTALDKSHLKQKKRLETNDLIRIGINKFQNNENPNAEFLKENQEFITEKRLS